MACVDCPPESVPVKQHAVRFVAWYVGGAVYQGAAAAWAQMPEDGMLAVKVFFNDGLYRYCSGNDWYGLFLVAVDEWTIIHNNNEDNFTRYPTALWKRGMWTSEAEMQAVNQAMVEAK